MGESSFLRSCLAGAHVWRLVVSTVAPASSSRRACRVKEKVSAPCRAAALSGNHPVTARAYPSRPEKIEPIKGGSDPIAVYHPAGLP